MWAAVHEIRMAFAKRGLTYEFSYVTDIYMGRETHQCRWRGWRGAELEWPHVTGGGNGGTTRQRFLGGESPNQDLGEEPGGE